MKIYKITTVKNTKNTPISEHGENYQRKFYNSGCCRFKHRNEVRKIEHELNPDTRLNIDEDSPLLIQTINLFSQEESLYEFCKKINQNPSLKKKSSFQYNAGDIQFFIGSAVNMLPEINNLKIIKDLNISCAPKILGFSFNENSKYTILAVKGVENPQDFYSSQYKIPTASKMNFIKDINKLNKVYLYNPAIDNPENWQTNSQGEIYIDNWKDLRSFYNDEELKNFYNRTIKKLGLILY